MFTKQLFQRSWSVHKYIINVRRNPGKFLSTRPNGELGNSRIKIEHDVNSFPQNENLYVYNFLKKIHPDDAPINNQLISDEESFNLCLNQNWRSSNIEDIVHTFIKVQPFSTEHNILLSDERFNKLVDGLMDHCTNLSDSQLLSLLQTLGKYPFYSAFDHNYHDIWSCLDDISIWKMTDWDFQTLFAICDAWFVLRLGRHAKTIYRAIDKLHKKAHRLTKDELLRAFFYLNIYRKRSVDFEFEHALCEKINELTLDEMAICALGYFKTESKIRPLPIAEAMMKMLKESASDVHEITMTAILKTIRHTSPLKLIPEINELTDALVPELDRFSDIACLHLALLCSNCQTLHETCLLKCSQKLLKSLPNLRVKELERTMNYLTMFSFDPKTNPDIFEEIYKEIHKKERILEFKQYKRCLTSTLYYFSLHEKYSYELMNNILDENSINATYGKSKIVPIHLFSLDIIIDIDCPDYSGNRISKTKRYKSAKFFAEWPPTYDQQKKKSIKDQLFLDTLDVVKRIVGDQNYKIEHVLPHFTSADIIICKDATTGKFKPTNDLDQYILGDVMRPNLIGKHWYAIVVLTWNNLIRNTTIPLGNTSMKLRQLEKIGYRPILIHYTEFINLTPEQKEQYVTWRLNN